MLFFYPAGLFFLVLTAAAPTIEDNQGHGKDKEGDVAQAGDVQNERPKQKRTVILSPPGARPCFANKTCGPAYCAAKNMSEPILANAYAAEWPYIFEDPPHEYPNYLVGWVFNLTQEEVTFCEGRVKLRSVILENWADYENVAAWCRTNHFNYSLNVENATVGVVISGGYRNPSVRPMLTVPCTMGGNFSSGSASTNNSVSQTCTKSFRFHRTDVSYPTLSPALNFSMLYNTEDPRDPVKLKNLEKQVYDHMSNALTPTQQDLLNCTYVKTKT